MHGPAAIDARFGPGSTRHEDHHGGDRSTEHEQLGAGEACHSDRHAHQRGTPRRGVPAVCVRGSENRHDAGGGERLRHHDDVIEPERPVDCRQRSGHQRHAPPEEAPGEQPDPCDHGRSVERHQQPLGNDRARVRPRDGRERRRGCGCVVRGVPTGWERIAVPAAIGDHDRLSAVVQLVADQVVVDLDHQDVGDAQQRRPGDARHEEPAMTIAAQSHRGGDDRPGFSRGLRALRGAAGAPCGRHRRCRGRRHRRSAPPCPC